MIKERTMLGDKFTEKGVNALNVQFQLALAQFQNNGGTYGVALAMLNAAYGRGASATANVPQGLTSVAEFSPQNDGEKDLSRPAEKASSTVPFSPSPERSAGQEVTAEKVLVDVPDAATQRTGAGQALFADKANETLPRLGSLRNMPGHARRGLVAIQSVQNTVSKSLFDTTMLPDGRRLREVRWGECPNLAGRYRKLSRVLMAIHNVGQPADPNATVDSIINEDGLLAIVNMVERFNDIQ